MSVELTDLCTAGKLQGEVILQVCRPSSFGICVWNAAGVSDIGPLRDAFVGKLGGHHHVEAVAHDGML